MEIIHRIYITADPAICQELEALGIKLREGLASFEVAESDPRWPEIERWRSRRGALDVVSTRFTRAEVDAARWLAFGAEWVSGYPQPESALGYRHVSYDLSQYCEQCGIGAVQKAPIRLKGEPKWGRRSFLQVNWLFDVVFVTPTAWEAIFRPLGIQKLPVHDARGSRELETVVQLQIHEAGGSTMLEGYPMERCTRCGRPKYLPNIRGPHPRVSPVPEFPMAMTREFFGTGGQAFRAVLVSQEVRHRIIEAGLKGANFKPVVD